jgi:hypothetical protein
VRYDTRYVIISGIAWIRTTRVELADGGVVDSVWAVTFDDGLARKADRGDSTIECGGVDDLRWEIEWRALCRPITTPHALLRPFTPTRLVTTPAILVNGAIGDRMLVDAPGHTATLSGRRHAETWGWAHASDADGRWAQLLTVVAPPFPRLSHVASDRGGPGLPIARGAVDPPRVRVGNTVVEAPPESFLGLEYLDTDGSSVWCFHSEEARLGSMPAAMEIATREPLDGWRVIA